MKKSLIIALSILFVLGLIITDYAAAAEETKITLGGSIRVRGEYQDNTVYFNDDVADYTAYYDTRVRLSIDAQVSPNTTGRIQLENGADSGVDSNTKDTYTWGVGGAEGKGIYGEGNGKRGDMRILEAWIQSKNLFGSSVGLKVGHMPLALGNKLFFNHSKFGDDAIMLFVEPTKEVNIALIDAKLTENTTTLNEDTDAYVALFTYKGAGFNVSGDATYLDDQNYVVSGSVGKGLHFWNFGLRGDTKVADLGLKADVELQSGKSENAAGTETKFKGHAFLVGADYKIGDITLDAAVAYGSGDGDATDNKVKTFVTALSGSQNYTYVYDYRAKTAGVTAPGIGATSGPTGTGIANTTYYKLGATATPVKDLSANLSLYLLRATKAVSTATQYNSKSIGTELDTKVTYKLDRNLVYFVEGGYLWAGKFYKNITGADVNPDNAYAVRHGVELTF